MFCSAGVLYLLVLPFFAFFWAMQMIFFILPLAVILFLHLAVAQSRFGGMRMNGFQMLLCVNMAALTTAIVMCSMK